MQRVMRTELALMVCVGVLLAGVHHHSNAEARDTKKRLVIVAPERFHLALREFVRHKRKQLPTELVSLEHLLTTSPGVDAPELCAAGGRPVAASMSIIPG